MIGRPPSCTCDACLKCKRRVIARARYQAMSMEERRAMIARRDREKLLLRDRERYWRDYEKRREAMRLYRNTPEGRAKQARGSQAWADRNPEKRKAQYALNNAVRDGRIIKQSCEICDNSDSEEHHADYSKPLEVQWFCRKHHAQVHQMMRVFAA